VCAPVPEFGLPQTAYVVGVVVLTRHRPLCCLVIVAVLVAEVALSKTGVSVVVESTGRVKANVGVESLLGPVGPLTAVTVVEDAEAGEVGAATRRVPNQAVRTTSATSGRVRVPHSRDATRMR